MARTFKTLQGCVPVRGIVLGPIDNNTYLISDEKGALLVDPSSDALAIMRFLGGMKIDAIVLTHRHHDHVDAAAAVREATGATVIASEADASRIESPLPSDGGFAPCPVDRRVKDGDMVVVGNMSWKVITTPGHTPGSMCLLLDPESTDHPEKAPVLIAGDTLFFGSIGRTDFEGGDINAMRRSLRRLQALPDETVVLPGHGNMTTIGAEQRRVFAFYL